MQLEFKNIEAAVQENLITPEQAKKLWLFWQQQQENTPQFRFSHVLYYFGGLLAISAVTLFVTNAWGQLRGVPLFILSSLFFILGLLLTHSFLSKKLQIPAGILAVFSLAVVPLAVYNIQIWLGWLPDQNYQYADFHYLVNWYWVPMEVITLMIGVGMLYYYRFPFLQFPIAVLLWYLSMDLLSLLFHLNDFSHRTLFSIIFGLLVLAIAIYLDFKQDDKLPDYAYWLYITGVIIFWGGLTCQNVTNELGQLFYALINVVMIFVGVFLNRRVFTIFGVLGVFSYLGHLAFSLFASSLAFPVALVFLGLLIIVAATQWVKMERKLRSFLAPYLPAKILAKWTVRD